MGFTILSNLIKLLLIADALLLVALLILAFLYFNLEKKIMRELKRELTNERQLYVGKYKELTDENLKTRKDLYDEMARQYKELATNESEVV